MKYVKIPDSFKIGGQTINVKMVERCDDNTVGTMCLAEGTIEIAEKFNKDKEQSADSKVNTFYHELTHCILDTMGEDELSKNEKFVNCFAGFLSDAMESAVFIEED